MLLRGSKLHIVNQLCQIAHSVTHTDYPEVVIIENPQDPSLSNQPGLFIKRSFSEAAAHVMRVGNEKAAAQLPAMVADTETFYNHQSLRKIGIILE